MNPSGNLSSGSSPSSTFSSSSGSVAARSFSTFHSSGGFPIFIIFEGPLHKSALQIVQSADVFLHTLKCIRRIRGIGISLPTLPEVGLTRLFAGLKDLLHCLHLVLSEFLRMEVN